MLFARFLTKRPKTASDAPPPAPVQSQDDLAAQARHSTDSALRRAAVTQLFDLSLLQQIASDDAAAEVRKAAAARYQELLCTSASANLSLAAQQTALAASDDVQLIEFVAIHAQEPTVRRAALERVNTPIVLAECAVNDALAVHRNLAMERLHDRAALEQVARSIGKKDKHIHRVARDKLRQIAEQEARPAQIRTQCEELCAKIARLGRSGNAQQDRALLVHLERQWAAVADEAPADLHAHFQAERERFLAIAAEQSRNAERQLAAQDTLDAAHNERQTLLNALTAAATLTDEMAISAERERIHAAWLALPPVEAQHRNVVVHYQHLLQAVDNARNALIEQRKNTERLQRTLAQVQRLLDDTKLMEHRRARTLIEQGRSLAIAQPDLALAQEFAAVAERLETRLNHQRKHAEQRLQQLPERLAELEMRLDAGELKKADPLYQSLQAALELIHASELPKQATADIAQRLRHLAPQLRELQHWRRWGADQHREGLCAEMDALIHAEMPLAALAERLHTLQMDWKQLDQSGSPANQALWERFHAASELVYARCRPFMEMQAQEREANRQARELVCAQIEEFLNQVDWERVEWKKILRAERDTRQTWAAIGATEGRHRKALERRFHQSLRQLDRRLDAERKANQAHKHQLIEQARALAEVVDLDAAIEQVKKLQREWHTTVPTHQKTENRLWQNFRTACDAVFERRAALTQAHTNALRDHLAVREAICAEALALMATVDVDSQQLIAQLSALEERWRVAQHLPIPRQAAATVAQQWHDCHEALTQRIHAAVAQQQQAALALLQQQAALCEQLEHSVLGVADEPIAPEIAQQCWQALQGADHDHAVHSALATRFERALAAAVQPEQLELLRSDYAVNGAQRQRLCVQLEIIAGIESPPEFAQQRLEFQVARLAERMVAGEDDPLRGATQLLHEWFRCGPAPMDAALAARFIRVYQTLAG
ncbi:hypothetical protein CKO09_11340 [Chromatium weissei]|nr:hypothetical protein [Chromatium weissei]